MRISTRVLARELGQDLVEYALIAPILMLLIIGIMEFSVVILSYNTIANAAREGARAGIVPNSTDADVIAASQRLTTGLNTAQLTFATPVRSNGTIKVQIDYTVALMTGPFVAAIGGSSTIPLQAVATMQVE